jgi:ABC-type transport system involved in cytochrome c biogenesis ATPase subunit
MILVKDLTIERSNKYIFENVNLSLGSGKIILLKGKNGSGKTTLLKALLNLIEPSSGAIYWKGKLLKKNLYNFFNNVTYIADRTSSLSKLSVQENIKIWKKIFLSNISNSQVENILKTLKLDIYLDQKVYSLSFGETKKIGVFTINYRKQKNLDFR